LGVRLSFHDHCRWLWHDHGHATANGNGHGKTNGHPKPNGHAVKFEAKAEVIPQFDEDEVALMPSGD